MTTVLRQKEISKTFQLADGSLEEKREPVFVYIHCYNQACTKYHNLQSNLNFELKVPGVREETQYTYKDRGGDAPGIENSHIRWMTQDVEQMKCSECGQNMNVSGTPSYKLTQYGVGPGTGLKGAERAAALAVAQVAETTAGRDAEIDDLKQQVRQQTALLQKLLDSEKANQEAQKLPNRPGKPNAGS